LQRLSFLVPEPTDAVRFDGVYIMFEVPQTVSEAFVVLIHNTLATQHLGTPARAGVQPEAVAQKYPKCCQIVGTLPKTAL